MSATARLSKPPTLRISPAMPLAPLILVFAVLRVVAAVHAPLVFPDTRTYLGVSFAGHAERPWTVPLLWSLLGSNDLREAFQVALGVVSWSVLAVSVGRTVSSRSLRLAGVALILLLALVPQVAGWDGMLLAESISTSLLALLVAVLLALGRRTTRARLTACLVLTVLLVFTKQSVTLIFLALVPFIVAFSAWRLPRRTAAGVVAALLALSLWSGFVLTRPAGDAPWKENATTMLVDRIAHDPSAVRFFESRGFPADALPRAGQTIEAAGYALWRNPAAAQWLRHHFRSTYFAFLSRHLSTALLSPLAHAPQFFGHAPVRGMARRVLPLPLLDALWDSLTLTVLELLATLLLVAVAVRHGARVRARPILALLAGIGVGGAVIIWNTTDPAEWMTRQLLPVLVAIRILLIVGAVLAADAAIGAGAGRPLFDRVKLAMAGAHGADADAWRGLFLPLADLRRRYPSWRSLLQARPSTKAVAIAAGLIAFAALRAVVAVHAPIRPPESFSYLKLSFVGGAERPWMVPFVWSIFPADGLREAVQVALGIAAWSLLAVSLARTLAVRWLQILAAAAVLLTGLVPQVAGWDGTLLSESISTSLMVLLLAGLLALTRRPGPGRVGACLAVLLLFVFTRQANTLIYLALVPLLLLYVLLRLPWREARWVGGALAIIALWGGFVLTRPQASVPWKQNAVTILVQRIAFEPGAARFFRAHGAPARAVSSSWVGSVSDPEPRLLRDPGVVRWIDHHFRSTYLAYLERDWTGAITGPLAKAPRYLRATSPAMRATSLLPAAAVAALWSTSPLGMVLEWAITLVLVAVAAWVGRRHRVISLIGLIAAATVVGSVLILDTTAPAMDLARELLPVMILMHLLVIVGLTTSLDALLAADAPARLRSRAGALAVPWRDAAGDSLSGPEAGRPEPGSGWVTLVFFVGSLCMSGWEHSLVGPLRLGRFVLAAGALALLIEGRGLRTIRERRGEILRGPAVAILAAGVVLVALVLISSHTVGCQCSGGSYGITELGIWMVLVYLAILRAPERAPMLLVAAGLGGVLAALIALAHPTGPNSISGGDRLAGTYGNANYFAATQAFTLPVGVYLLLRVRGWRMRLLAVAACGALASALLLSYSRSGILAAAAGVFVVVVGAIPRRLRIPVAAAMVAVAAAAALLLYPAFNRSRTAADFAYVLSIARTTDASGWQWSPTGLIRGDPARLADAGSGALSVTATARGGGASFPAGIAAGGTPYQLAFQARSPSPQVRLFYGMEDNLRANGPSVASVLLSPSWQPLTLMWRPPALSPDARLYFWTMGPARFELRGIRLTNLGSGAVRPVTTRLRGRFHNLRRALAERERRFIQSREGAARIAWHAFVTHPAFGVGWERFPAYAASRSGVGQIASHDDYLRFAAELGIPGLLALLCLCLAVGWAALRARSARWAPAALGVLAAGAVDVAFANILSVPEVTLPVATAAAAVAAAATRTGSLRSAWSRT